MPKAILIFGAAKLQYSIITRAKKAGLFTIVIDPDPNALCKELADVFEVIGGNDYEGTLSIAKKNNISGLITAATDKPLVMMARIAEDLQLPFFSVNTAVISTDKFLMKKAFLDGGVPCAKGLLAMDEKETNGFNFPVIVKPRDNSGSRGVIYCQDHVSLTNAFQEAKSFSKMDTLLVEEYIEGVEYSIESLHYQDKTVVVQYTEKITTSLPYNVEIGHNQPANLTDEQKKAIHHIIEKIAKALNFQNCAAHTELKINERGIFVIETSPRLGGDFITSHLVPYSTGINIEDALIQIAIGDEPIIEKPLERASIIRYFSFNPGKVVQLNLPLNPNEDWNSEYFSLDLKVGDNVLEIKNSLNRYGEIIFCDTDLSKAVSKYDLFLQDITERIKVDENLTNKK